MIILGGGVMRLMSMWPGTFFGVFVPPYVLEHVPGHVSPHFRAPIRAPQTTEQRKVVPRRQLRGELQRE